jgi:DNA replication protein DnaC
MKAAQLERLQDNLTRLRLFKSRERLEALLQEATGKEMNYADFLDCVLTEEVLSKTAKNVTMRAHLARFPFVKGLEVFDFAYQPSLDKKQVQQLASCHFIEHGESLVILGPPGVGKTHLAVGLGIRPLNTWRIDQLTEAARHDAFVVMITLAQVATDALLDVEDIDMALAAAHRLSDALGGA